MGKKRIKSMLLLVALIGILLSTTFSASAESYKGYNYDSWGKSEAVPNGYQVQQVFESNNLPCGAFSDPTDFYCYDGFTYVLDSGNGRIVILNDKFEYCSVIDHFSLNDGTLTELKEASGIFVYSNDKIFIADTGNNRVLKVDSTGKVLGSYERPQSANFPDDLEFLPKKIAVDRSENLYVLSNGFYYGSVVYNTNGDFQGFYGANKVEMSISQRIDLLWRKILSEKQVSYMAQYVPIEYSSMDIDDSGFIYTVTMNTTTSTHEIKKLNYLGENVMAVTASYDPIDKSDYGDRENHSGNSVTIDTQFCDIAVMQQNFAVGLDKTRGRVFLYDKDSNLLSVFGGIGDQQGLSVTPVAVETIGDNVLVLDKGFGSITVYEPTEYGRLLIEATNYNNSGILSDDTSMWDKILKINANSELACKGLGALYLNNGNYSEAMKYFYRGQDRTNYSRAFGFYRTQVVRENFPIIITLFIAVILILLYNKKIRQLLIKIFKIKVKERDFKISDLFKKPIDFYERLFSRKRSTELISAFVVLLAFVIARILQRQTTAFVFNLNDLSAFNIFFILLQSAGILMLFVISDKIVGSLRFGKSNIRFTFTGMAFAFVPYIISIYVNVIMSYFFTYEEGVIMTLITGIGLLYSAFLIFTSIRLSQQYEVGETMVIVVLDAITAVIVLFLLVLIASLLQQFFTFLSTVYSELVYRI